MIFPLLATFQIIKRLLPAKAVDRLKNINNKNIRDYIDEDYMLVPWGGKDDYEFKFIPEQRQPEPSLLNNNNNIVNHNNNSIKKVSFEFFIRVTKFTSHVEAFSIRRHSGREKGFGHKNFSFLLLTLRLFAISSFEQESGSISAKRLFLAFFRYKLVNFEPIDSILWA